MQSAKKKSVSILVVEDDDVVQHMLIADDGVGGAHHSKHSSGSSRKSKQKPELEYKISKQKPHHREFEDDIDENIGGMGVSSAMDVDDPDCLYGNEMYKFKTPKKGAQMKMVLKAQAAASPNTPGKASGAGGVESPVQGVTGGASPAAGLKRTPSRRAKAVSTESPVAESRTPSRRSKTGPLTPIPQRLTGGPAQRDHDKAQLSTPYRLRARNLVSMAEGDGTDEDSVEESDDEEEEEMETGRGRGGARGDSRPTDMVASAEAYFDLHAMNPVTSDRTLSNLATPRMDIAAIQQVLKDLAPSHVTHTAGLVERHKGLFNRWMLNMGQGYNILTYGLGSKLSLLEAFRQSHLKPFSHLVVNGYFPSLTVKHILNSITEDILKDSRSFSSLFAQIEFIENYFTKNEEDCYLVIHNMDGVLLRSKKFQNILSLLAAIPGLHLVASVDHINAPFLWDEIQFFRLRWLWYDTCTFLPYEAENSYENSLMVAQSGGLALSSLAHVMRSLTPNARRIFLTLAQFQLEASNTVTNYDGMSFQALYQKCREDFLVNSDLTLQAQLVEFKDHRLIRVKKNFEGIEHLVIPIDKSTLKVFLDDQRDPKT